MTPSIGRIVHVLVAPEANNGSDIAAAVITRAWSESGPGRWTVNYRILGDHAPERDEWKTSAYLYDGQDVAEASISRAAEDQAAAWQKPVAEIAATLRRSGMHAFWPPKV